MTFFSSSPSPVGRSFALNKWITFALLCLYFKCKFCQLHVSYFSTCFCIIKWSTLYPNPVFLIITISVFKFSAVHLVREINQRISSFTIGLFFFYNWTNNLCKFQKTWIKNFSMSFDRFSSFSIGVILTTIQTVFAVFKRIGSKLWT